jgi:hypothetical protein
MRRFWAGLTLVLAILGVLSSREKPPAVVVDPQLAAVLPADRPPPPVLTGPSDAPSVGSIEAVRAAGQRLREGDMPAPAAGDRNTRPLENGSEDWAGQSAVRLKSSTPRPRLRARKGFELGRFNRDPVELSGAGDQGTVLSNSQTTLESMACRSEMSAGEVVVNRADLARVRRHWCRDGVEWLNELDHRCYETWSCCKDANLAECLQRNEKNPFLEQLPVGDGR